MGGEWRSCLLPRESGAITAREQMPNPYVNPVCVYVYRLLLRYLRERVWYKGLWRKVIWLQCYGHCDPWQSEEPRHAVCTALFAAKWAEIKGPRWSGCSAPPLFWFLCHPSFAQVGWIFQKATGTPPPCVFSTDSARMRAGAPNSPWPSSKPPALPPNTQQTRTPCGTSITIKYSAAPLAILLCPPHSHQPLHLPLKTPQPQSLS